LYLVFGDKVLDSVEILENINQNTYFKVEKDLTKATKREDVLAYKVSIDVEKLNEVLKENFDLSQIDEEELFDEYMTLCDELTLDLIDFVDSKGRILSRSYKWDTYDDTVKCVVAFSSIELSELKLFDVIKRLLTQID